MPAASSAEEVDVIEGDIESSSGATATVRILPPLLLLRDGIVFPSLVVPLSTLFYHTAQPLQYLFNLPHHFSVAVSSLAGVYHHSHKNCYLGSTIGGSVGTYVKNYNIYIWLISSMMSSATLILYKGVAANYCDMTFS